MAPEASGEHPAPGHAALLAILEDVNLTLRSANEMQREVAVTLARVAERLEALRREGQELRERVGALQCTAPAQRRRRTSKQRAAWQAWARERLGTLAESRIAQLVVVGLLWVALDTLGAGPALRGFLAALAGLGGPSAAP